MAGKRERMSGRSRGFGLFRFRRPIRFSFAGKLFLGVTFGVGIAAVNTGNNLLYLVLSLLLSLLLLSGILSELSLFRLRVKRRLPARAFAQTPCLIEIEVENRKRRTASYSVEVEDQADVSAKGRRCFFLKVGPKVKQTTGYHRTPSKRGWLHFERYRLITRFPFGLIEKRWSIRHADRLLIFPKVDSVDVSDLEQLFSLGDHQSPFPGNGSTSSELREYRQGDEARFIHWRRSAALVNTVVRERKRESGPHLVLRLDNRRPEGAGDAWDEAFEAAVSRAASLASAALARGAGVQVQTWSGASPSCAPNRAPDPIWAYLALVESVPLSSNSQMEKRRAGQQMITVEVSGTSAVPTREVHA